MILVMKSVAPWSSVSLWVQLLQYLHTIHFSIVSRDRYSQGIWRQTKQGLVRAVSTGGLPTEKKEKENTLLLSIQRSSQCRTEPGWASWKEQRWERAAGHSSTGQQTDSSEDKPPEGWSGPPTRTAGTTPSLKLNIILNKMSYISDS